MIHRGRNRRIADRIDAGSARFICSRVGAWIWPKRSSMGTNTETSSPPTWPVPPVIRIGFGLISVDRLFQDAQEVLSVSGLRDFSSERLQCLGVDISKPIGDLLR